MHRGLTAVTAGRTYSCKLQNYHLQFPYASFTLHKQSKKFSPVKPFPTQNLTSISKDPPSLYDHVTDGLTYFRMSAWKVNHAYIDN